MNFSPELAEIRYGYGLSPAVAAPGSTNDMLAGLTGPDVMARRFPIESFDRYRQRLIDAQTIRRQRKKVKGTPEAEDLRKERQKLIKAARQAMVGWFGQSLMRCAHSPTAFRERLTWFWADHFTAIGKGGVIRHATSPYVEEAIRPYLSGRFADLLVAAVSHPLMLHYLDQTGAVGPGSRFAATRKTQLGLNENLAREVLELHTLGVGGAYSQQDVRQLAELFTGMTFGPKVGFRFKADRAEPGAEILLGKRYGGDPAQMSAVRAALGDLAVHPDTARHIARKLAVHFVSDTPDAAFVDHVAARFVETDGDLMAVYGALLDHPAAWEAALRNVKPPFDFLASTCRALSVQPEVIAALKPAQVYKTLITPMALMGQRWQTPDGPDGWPEQDEAWITPQGLSTRLRWAIAAPPVLRADLPDPRRFVDVALGQQVPPPVRFAAEAAESRSEAIGLVLASPAFQRR